MKRAILHRKNALYCRTLSSAQVGELFMTLFHTAELCGANSLDYLTELQRHAAELANPPRGMDSLELSQHYGRDGAVEPCVKAEGTGGTLAERKVPIITVVRIAVLRPRRF